MDNIDKKNYSPASLKPKTKPVSWFDCYCSGGGWANDQQMSQMAKTLTLERCQWKTTKMIFTFNFFPSPYTCSTNISKLKCQNSICIIIIIILIIIFVKRKSNKMKWGEEEEEEENINIRLTNNSRVKSPGPGA